MNTLKEDIKTGKFRKAYLFYGEEAYLKTYYKNQVRKALIQPGDAMNLNVYTDKGISVPAVIAQAETMPFFADRRLLIIEDSGFFKASGASAGSQELAEYLPSMPEETVLLFVETEVDKRSKLYKAVKSAGLIVEFKYQTEQSLKNWILKRLGRDNLKITGNALEMLLECTGTDMERISTELEKLTAYVYGREGITKEDIEAVCSIRIENRIFDMLRAVGEKNRKRALELYDDLLALKEPPLKILLLLGRQFNQILMVKDLRSQGFDQAAIASRTGLQGFVVRNCLRQAEAFSSDTLHRALEDCAETDEAVKSGRVSDRMGVELLLMKYSEKARTE